MSARARREPEQPLPDGLVEALAELALALAEDDEQPKTQEQKNETHRNGRRLHSD